MKMIKKASILLLIFSLIFALTGCGVSDEDFIEAVKRYKFTGDSRYEGSSDPFEAVKAVDFTVSDFVQQIESSDGTFGTFDIATDIRFDMNLKSNNPYISDFKKSNKIVYDYKKHYGILEVWYNVNSNNSTDFMIWGVYDFLFSLDKEGKVTPEACAHLTDTGEYVELKTSKADIKDTMTKIMSTMWLYQTMDEIGKSIFGISD